MSVQIVYPFLHLWYAIPLIEKQNKHVRRELHKKLSFPELFFSGYMEDFSGKTCDIW
jgi:hypothetical protein